MGLEKLIEFIVKLGILALVWSIFGSIILGMLSSMLGILFGGFLSVVGVMAGILIFIKILSSSTKKPKKTSKKNTGNDRVSSNLDKFMDWSERSETEQALKQFFKMNDKLIVRSDELYLRPSDGVYTNMGELVLWFKGEAITTLETLTSEHADKSMEILDFIRGKSPRTSAATPQKAEASTTRAQDFIKKLKAINDGIPDEAITAELHRTSGLLGGVHRIELKNPDSDKLRKLYDYYLPIMMSMLTKFITLSENAPLSRDYIELKSKLTETVGMINDALSNISGEYFGEEMADISVDARTLQSILKKDGFAGNDFRIYENLDRVVEEEKELLANEDI